MQQRVDLQRQFATALDEPPCESGQQVSTCLVLVIGSLLAQVDPLIEEVTEQRRLERGVIIVWQAETDVGRSEEQPPSLAVALGPLTELEDGAALEPGGRYHVPAHRRVWFEGMRVRVAPRSRHDDRPIDRLLLTLAEGWGKKAASAIGGALGKDGECGLRIIRAVGGLGIHRPAPVPRASALAPDGPVQRAEHPPAGSAPSESPPSRSSGVAFRLSHAFSLPSQRMAGARAASSFPAGATPDDEPTARAAAQGRHQAALVRLSQLALTLADPRSLCEEALGVLFGTTSACSAGLIVALEGGTRELEVLASRGFGMEPLRALRSLGDAAALLDAVLDAGCIVSQSGERVWIDPSVSTASAEKRLATPPRPMLASVTRGVGCPISADGEILGVIALYGRRAAVDDSEHRQFFQSVARLLGGAIVRQRARQRLALELEVSRQSEALHRQKSAELEALYASLPVGVSIHDRKGSVRHVNRHLALLQAAPEAAGAGPLRRLYADEVPSWVARVLQSGEPIHDVELSVSDGDESPCWLCNFAPIRDADGRVHGASAVVQDITARKRVELELREADQQKDDFLAMLGHELRNPMAAIRNATELLSRIDQPSPQLLRLQSIFDRQTRQTTTLIDGLLDVARVARGKVTLQLAPVPVVELVRRAVDDRRQHFQGRRLDLRLPDDEIWAVADRGRLVQILDNLISNALKFTPASGNIRVQVACARGKGSIRVEDEGMGIDAELLPQIFEPFRQGHPMTAQSQGLGLGLALVKGLVDLHGFQLMAHSDGRDRGASFQIDFPVAIAPDAPAPQSRVDMRGLDLLLVEDNLDVAETLAELLTSDGHRVIHAASAEDALRALHGQRPDVVLCDIGLPGMDGLELAKQLRADPELMDLELVAMTGFGDASTQGRVERAGFDRYLIKPVQLEALRHCLSRVAALPPTRIRRL